MSPYARKRFGQHFLVDGGALERIAAAAQLDAAAPLLEIGPGRGALTRVLLEHVDRMGVVELDRDLAAAIAQRYAPDRVRLWGEDVLKLSFEEVRQALAGDGRRLVIVGNLPYNISKPIAAKFVRERAAIDRAVLMFQKEVADRLTAGPGSRAYGPLAVLCGEVWKVERSFDLSPKAFRPRPKVTSTVTTWTPRSGSWLTPERERRLRTVIAACFGRRRQTLRNNLRAALGSAAAANALLETTGLDGGLRAEVLESRHFHELAKNWPG